MTEDSIAKLNEIAIAAFSDLSLDAKIVALRYASEEGEITPEMLGSILQGIKDAIPETAMTGTVNSIIQKFQ